MIDKDYINKLPTEILLKILEDTSWDAALVCKNFNQLIPAAFKYNHWNTLKNDENFPADFRKKLSQIEKNTAGNDKSDGRKLFGTFFRSLHKPENSKPITGLNFLELRSTMFPTWHADHVQQDPNLVKCWSRIARSLKLENPPTTAEAIRIWMNHEDNQNRLAQISELNLSRLELTTLPPEILRLSGLTRLHLSRNKLTKLPDYLEKLPALTYLDLSNNKFTELPDCIEKLFTLTELEISNNLLTELPDTIQDLTELTRLIISKNKLTKLPETLGNLYELKYLDLSNNELTEVPDTIGNLYELEYLDISNNKLTVLPDKIEDLAQLTELNISMNKLLMLPQALANLGQIKPLEVFFADNILLLVPACVLEKFEDQDDIQSYISLRDEMCSSPLDNLCQLIRKNSDKILDDEFDETEALGNLVDALEESDREELYSKISEQDSEENEGNFDWAEENRFNQMGLFVSVLGEFLYDKQK